MNFIPDAPSVQQIEIPYFEDVTAKDVPGKAVHYGPAYYQRKVEESLYKLGALNVQWVSGRYEEADERSRDGFEIRFAYAGFPGRVRAAALPCRRGSNREKAKAQSLYLVNMWLESERVSFAYRPGSNPLAPYLIGEGGKTAIEMLVERGQLPMLTAGTNGSRT